MGVLCVVLAACGGAENSDSPNEGNSGGSGGATGGSGGSTGGVTVNTGGFHTDGGAPTGGSGGNTAGTGGVGDVDSGPPPIPPSWQTYLQIAGFARGNGVYVAVGTDMENYDDPTEDPVVYTSPDGFAWTPSATLPSRPTDVAFGNGVFVAMTQVGTPLRVYRSEDGSTWTTTEIPGALPYAGKALAFGNGTFVVAAADAVLTSTDGKNWKSTPRQSMFGVEFGAGKFVGWNYGAQLESSKNGVDWTPSNPVEGKVKYNDLFLFGSEKGFQGVLAYYCCFGEVPPKFAAIQSTDSVAWKLDETRATVPAVEEAGVCITFDRDSYRFGGTSTFSAGPTCDSVKPTARDHGFQPQVILREGPAFLLGGMAGIYSSKDGLHWEPTLIHSKQITN